MTCNHKVVGLNSTGRVTVISQKMSSHFELNVNRHIVYNVINTVVYRLDCKT